MCFNMTFNYFVFAFLTIGLLFCFQGNLTMPPYFAFLTLMALRVFLEERVDVAVIEVGIGGEYDSTNLVQ